MRQILESVNFMHKERGITHRDLKLENVLIDKIFRRYPIDEKSVAANPSTAMRTHEVDIGRAGYA